MPTRFAAAGLLALGLAAAAPAAFAATPAMTPGQAKAYLAEQGIDPLPDNYPQAIMNGDAKAVDSLIALGVDVNAKTSLPQSPLELAATACAGGHVASANVIAVMQSLIKAGADPNAPGIQGLGPLMIAAQQCDGPVIKTLLAAGAKIDLRTPQGFTPLTMALITKHYSAADALIDAGARITPAEAAKFKGGPPDEALDAALNKASGG